MTVVSALLAGGAIGVRHAVEADHLAAVAALLEDETVEHPGGVGASWGVGHTLPIAALGLLFVAGGVRLPPSVAVAFEALVGAVLVGLGLRMLAAAVGVDGHAHGGAVHRHLDGGALSLGWRHSHVDDASFVVGVLHGFAGSGALVVALVAAAPSVESALAYLVAFALTTVATMSAVATVWARTLDIAAAPVLRGVAGAAGAVVGLALLAASVPALL
ncbi:MAG: high-affinity nickel-transporter protein [Haloarculaceae archaeon]